MARPADRPNLFLSWSRDPSRLVAEALRDALPTLFLGHARPWISGRDIKPGEDWWRTTSAILGSIRAGIFVLTPENLNAPWMMFEAGAIAGKLARGKGKDKGTVFVYLIGLDPEDLEATHPLRPYQAVRSTKSETWRLMQAINGHLGTVVEEGDLRTSFDRHWRRLSGSIRVARGRVEAFQRSDSQDNPAARSDDVGKTVWSCLAPRLPLEEGIRDELRRRLRAIRELAYSLVADRFGGQGCRPHQVRTCLFLPNRDQVPYGFCELTIPRGLHDWDDPEPGDEARHRRETEISFLPNQGLVGRVFAEKLEPKVARSTSSPAAAEPDEKKPQTRPPRSQWSLDFGLTDFQKECIHPRMSWVIAFPLKKSVGGRDHIMGVLAVDGIDHPLEHDEVARLSSELIYQAIVLASALATAPLDWIQVQLREHVPHVVRE